MTKGRKKNTGSHRRGMVNALGKRHPFASSVQKNIGVKTVQQLAKFQREDNILSTTGFALIAAGGDTGDPSVEAEGAFTARRSITVAYAQTNQTKGQGTSKRVNLTAVMRLGEVP